MLFHIDYKPITDKLSKSLLERSYNQLLTRKCNPIPSNQIIEKHDQIGDYLYHVLEVYEKGKIRNKKNYIGIGNKILNSNIQNTDTDIKSEGSLLCNSQTKSEDIVPNDSSFGVASSNIPIVDIENEINTRVKEATDAMH